MKQIQNSVLLICMKKILFDEWFNPRTLLPTLLSFEALSYTQTLRVYVALLFISKEQQYNIVTCKSDYRRSLDWWLDLLTTYTLMSCGYTLQITDTHRLLYSVYYRFQ
jgi:hypothetical protein